MGPLLHGMWAFEMQFLSVIQKTFLAINGTSEPSVTIANIVMGIQQKMQEFRTVQLCHVKHQGNRPAHILMQYVKNIDHYVI